MFPMLQKLTIKWATVLLCYWDSLCSKFSQVTTCTVKTLRVCPMILKRYAVMVA